MDSSIIRITQRGRVLKTITGARLRSVDYTEPEAGVGDGSSQVVYAYHDLDDPSMTTGVLYTFGAFGPVRVTVTVETLVSGWVS